MHYSEKYHNRDANAVPEVGDFVFYYWRMYKVKHIVHIHNHPSKDKIRIHLFNYKRGKIEVELLKDSICKASGIFYPVTI